MDKIESMSLNLMSDNIEKMKKLFPSVVKEGKIDFSLLKELLGDTIDHSNEKYDFTWKGKKECIKVSQTPSTATLLPLKEKSLNWENTENLYLEGDNLEVLKLLQKTYYGKIGMIYIDPPYNTGTNLIYKNDFSTDVNDYLRYTNQMDEDGNIYSANPNTNGRFHSDWLSMMYARLLLAKNLLTDNGIIAIAIDDNEVHNLIKIGIEIFGESNYIGTIITRCNPQGRGKKNIDPCHEYHLIFSKNFEELDNLKIKNTEKNKSYKNFMRSGTNSRKYERPKRFYPMLVKDGIVSCITDEEYKCIYNELTKNFDENFIKELTLKYEKEGFQVIWPIASNGEEKVWQRVFERAKNECHEYILNGKQIQTPDDDYRTPMSLWLKEEYSNVNYGTNKLSQLFNDKKVFDYSKSIYTVKDIISLVDSEIVLDFFSGSATTAQAVMELNMENNSKKKFILVQLPEKICDENILNLGYRTICDVGEDRIKRVAKKINDSNNYVPTIFDEEKKSINNDLGFKVFKLESTNIKPWDGSSKVDEQTIFDFTDTIKEDRTNLDVAYEIMLKYGIFNMQLKEININNKIMYSVGEGYMIICLDNDITSMDVMEIANQKPHCVVFKEQGFADDNEKINATYTLERLGVEDVKCI